MSESLLVKTSAKFRVFAKLCLRGCTLKLQKWRLEGGIEPLRVSPPTGLKPAHRTTEDHLGEISPIFSLYKVNYDLFNFNKHLWRLEKKDKTEIKVKITLNLALRESLKPEVDWKLHKDVAVNPP